MQYAILIDAGFVKHKLSSASDKMNVWDIRSLVKSLVECPQLQKYKLHRVYYYDAMPYSGKEKLPLSSQIVDYSETPQAKKSIEFINEIKKEPFFAVRLGELSFEGWQVRPSCFNTSESSLTIESKDLSPKISQKGVDMRIGMDIASLTLKRISQILVLVTGDSDFVPAMKLARREGAELYIVTLGHKVKDAMLEHCDLTLELDPKIIRENAKAMSLNSNSNAN